MRSWGRSPRGSRSCSAHRSSPAGSPRTRPPWWRRSSRASTARKSGRRSVSCRTGSVSPRRPSAGDRRVRIVGREYPVAPLVGVGAVVVDGPRVLLVRRGRPPGLGRWSLPGGLVHVGESLEGAVRRQVAEGCGLTVDVHQLVGAVDRILRDDAGRVRYHYVLLDYLATPRRGQAAAGSDAVAIRWCEPGDLAQLDVTEGIESMVSRALAMDVERRRQEEAR